MENFSVKLAEGKYTFYTDQDGTLRCDRWRDFVGDHAVSLLYERILELEQERDVQLNAMQDMAKELRKLDDNPYAGNEDWAEMDVEVIVENFYTRNTLGKHKNQTIGEEHANNADNCNNNT